MILPKLVNGRKKIRNCKIVKLYSEGRTGLEIAQRFHITEQAINKVIHNNIHLLEIDKKFEKQKRLNKLQRVLENAGIQLSPKKDVLNVLEQMRREIEGDSLFTADVKQFIQVFLPANDGAIDSNPDNRLEAASRPADDISQE